MITDVVYPTTHKLMQKNSAEIWYFEHFNVKHFGSRKTIHHQEISRGKIKMPTFSKR